MSDLEYGFVPGRSRAKAVALLEAARAAKVDETLIKTRTGGYDVPTKVLDKYEGKLKGVLKAEEDAKAPSETLAPGTAEEVIATAEEADAEQREAAQAKADEESLERAEQAERVAAEQKQAEEDAAAEKLAAETEKAKQSTPEKPATKTPAKSTGKSEGK